MNKEESERFTTVISSGYKELITNRPPKPMEHFIFHLIRSLPEELRSKDPMLSQFYEQYVQEEEKFVHEI